MPRKRHYARKAKKGAKLTKVEKKKIDRLQYKCNAIPLYNQAVLTPPVTVGMASLQLNAALNQGDGTNQRTGNAVKPIKLRINKNLYFNTNAAGSVSECFCRVIYVQGTPSAPNAPTVNQLFENPATDQQCLYSAFNNDFVDVKGVDTTGKQRPIRVLYDSGVIYLKNGASPAPSSGTGSKEHMNIFKSFRNLRQIQFSGTAGTNIAANPIWEFAFCDATSAPHPPTLVGDTTMWYDNVI